MYVIMVAEALVDFGCKPSNCGLKSALDTEDGSFVFVVLAGPEKTFQPVLFMARHDMDVYMRHTLTDAIIDGYKGSLGL